MRWIDLVSRDQVPWLLDPENPSSRYLTLRDIFLKDPGTLAAEQARILDWEPIKILRGHWDPVSHWGRANAPYYGSAVGSFGTLVMLQQIGAPQFPEAQAGCEALLSTGRNESGVFTPGNNASAPWLCYTGIALQIMAHFGYADDPRTRATRNTLVHTILHTPEELTCPMIRGNCRDGIVKCLNALLHPPARQRSYEEERAIDILCGNLIDYSYDFTGEDSEWAHPGYPRYYDSDLLEMCHVLAHTKYRQDPRLMRLLEPLLALQDTEGKWHKTRQTPALSVERIQQPSRWLTYEAIHTLTLVYGDDIYGSR